MALECRKKGQRIVHLHIKHLKKTRQETTNNGKKLYLASATRFASGEVSA